MSARAAAPADWQRALQARAVQPPLRPRVPLRLAQADAEIGSVEPALAQRFAAAGLPVQCDDTACVVFGAADESLAQIARWLHGQALASRWRDELLAVADAQGRVHGAVERAAARPLGITTQAVHLVGRRGDGRFCLQQRAFDKATDPGLWDTLMGGLVAAGEGIADTLERETWEEAGLRLAELRELAPLGRLTVRRPVAEGYMVEHMHLFQARVPDTLQPVNQDGEVAAFAQLDAAALRARLAAGAFTLEAGLILAQVLEGPAAEGGTP